MVWNVARFRFAGKNREKIHGEILSLRRYSSTSILSKTCGDGETELYLIHNERVGLCSSVNVGVKFEAEAPSQRKVG